MRLLLVRHGLTDWNAAGRFQGQADIPLNEEGRKQAQALGCRLAGEKLDIIYTSDLQRALQTAQTISAACSCSVRPDSRLREIAFGDWEGCTYEDICRRWPQASSAWEADPTRVAPPGGENLRQLAERVWSALDELLNNHKGKTVLLTAHGGALQVLLCLALDLPAERYWQFHLSPASLTDLSFYPAGVILNLLNDTCHLENI